MPYLDPKLNLYFAFVMALFGLCMGSFLNCAAWRIVHGESLARGRSHCDSCGHVLGLKDLVPLASFIASKGRCRYCGAKLSITHLVAELLTAICYTALLFGFGLSAELIMWLCFASVVLCCAFADLEGYIIPDRLVLSAFFLRLAFFFMLEQGWPEALNALLGGVLVPGLVLLFVLAYEKLRRIEAMGGGDIKLLFASGIFLGWKNNILCIFIACVLGIITGSLSKPLRQAQDDPKIFPWGPSIAIAAIICALWGDEIVNAYLTLFL